MCSSVASGRRQSTPLESKKFAKNQEKEEKNWGKKEKNQEEEKLGRKGKNRQGSFTLLLLTEKAGYATEHVTVFSFTPAICTCVTVFCFTDLIKFKYRYVQIS